MNSFITLFNLERLFGWIVYNLLTAGLVGVWLFAQVALLGHEIVWGAPQVYTYDSELPKGKR